MRCKKCNGNGLIDDLHCPDCRGYGQEINALGRIKRKNECPKCCGDGRLQQVISNGPGKYFTVIGVDCLVCNGTGKITKK